jgi:hypothetical protein
VSAGGHVPDEIDVAGDIDNPYNAIVGQPAGREPEVDRQAALFFFGQSVRLAPGEEFHEGGLAVIDVPGCAQHDMSARCAHGWVKSLFADAQGQLGFCSLKGEPDILFDRAARDVVETRCDLALVF